MVWRLQLCLLLSWTHQSFGQTTNSSSAPLQDVWIGNSSSAPLRDVWIGKIFADSVWTFAPSSATHKECALQGRLYRAHLSNNTHWAVRMLDASTISVSGLLDGDVIQYGHPDQCIYTQVPIPHYTTQYCLPTATFAPRKSNALRRDYFKNSSFNDWPPYDTSKSIWDFFRPRADYIRDPRTRFSWGLCVPESCSAEDVESSLNATLGGAFRQHDIEFQVKLSPLMCYSAKEVETQRMPVPGKVWLYSISSLLLLLVIGTAVDYLKSSSTQDENHLNSSKTKKESVLESTLLIFSFIRNWNRLCSTQAEDEISIIHGVKFLTMSFVIMFHRLIIGIAFAQNLSILEEILHNTKYFLLNASTQMLDVFFFLSGFLLASVLIKKRVMNQMPSMPYVIVYRALRIYPIYLIAISFTLWVQPFVNQGPQWKLYAESDSQACKKYWWHNLLFISTLFENTDWCMPISWFLSTDFQLFIVSLIIIYVAERFPKHRSAILTTAFIVSYVVPSLVIYFSNADSYWKMKVSDIKDLGHAPYIRQIYVKFYMRAPSYVTGVCSAYLVHAALKKPFSLSGIQKLFLFIIFFSVQMLVFYVGSLFLLPAHAYNVWEHVAFAPIMRWTMANNVFLLILIHVCTDLGVVSKFLCHPVFTPLGRVTFHMYLVHFYVITWDVFSLSSAPHYSAFTFILRCCGDISLTLLLSLGTTLLIESPIGIMRKKLLKM